MKILRDVTLINPLRYYYCISSSGSHSKLFNPITLNCTQFTIYGNGNRGKTVYHNRQLPDYVKHIRQEILAGYTVYKITEIEYNNMIMIKELER